MIVTPQPLGQWKVTASGPEGDQRDARLQRQPAALGDPARPLETRDLDGLFGKDGYSLADDPESLKRVVTGRRIGHEIFPWLMVLILILVTAENFLANKFYRESGARPAAVAS